MSSGLLVSKLEGLSSAEISGVLVRELEGLNLVELSGVTICELDGGSEGLVVTREELSQGTVVSNGAELPK